MKLKISLFTAVLISVISLIVWETNWRSKGYAPSIDDNKDLWVVQRHKVNTLTDQDVILTGSSRVLFDIQLDVWEGLTGIRPIQLASVGSSPLPIFHDLVENTDFSGTILVGVTPGLFFSTLFPEADPWKRPQSKVDHYYDQTYAEKLNHRISLPLQKNLVFISAEEESTDDDKDLKTLLENVQISDRIPKGYPPFYQFGEIDIDRNMRMLKRTETDTAFANTIIRAWVFIMSSGGPPPDVKGTMGYFLKDAKKFQERGGNLILLRCPSSGGVLDGETKFLPRATLFDVLADSAKAHAYHFQDYEQLTGYNCPEWSHLSASDADRFTKDFVNIILKDNAIPNKKTN
ncbi:MAG: hypothetical protein HKO00_10915 [Flavobacteriaceae bacterium]|nr:hypothetical protein [Flavobacteriaceae bacterium]